MCFEGLGLMLLFVLVPPSELEPTGADSVGLGSTLWGFGRVGGLDGTTALQTSELGGDPCSACASPGPTSLSLTGTHHSGPARKLGTRAW